MKTLSYILILLGFSAHSQTLVLDLTAKSPFYTTTSLTTPCTTTGQVIGQWTDASGNGNTATVSTNPPTYSTNGGPNGQRAIAFNGSNQYLVTPAILNSTFNNGFAIIIVGKGVAGAGGQITVGGQNNCLYDYHNYSNDNQAIVFGNIATGAPSGKYPLRINDTAFITGVIVRPNYQGSTNFPIDSSFVYFYYGSQSGLLFQNSTGFLNNSSASICNIATTHKFIPSSENDALQIGSAYGGGSYWAGTISEVQVWKGIPSNVWITNQIYTLANNWGFNFKRMVVWSGNSEVSGSGTTGTATQTCRPTGTNPPGCFWLAADSTKYDVRTDAYPGRTLNQMIVEAFLFSPLYINPNTTDIDITWEIVNTLAANHSPTATENLLKQYCQMRQALGFKEMVVTCIARGVTGVYTGFNNDRDSVNAWVMRNYSSFANMLYDAAGQSIFQTVTSTYYASDSLHLNNRGSDSIGVQSSRIMKSYISTNNLK